MKTVPVPEDDQPIIKKMEALKIGEKIIVDPPSQ
jgi:hypothetical protein